VNDLSLTDEVPEELLRAEGAEWLRARGSCPPPDLLMARGSEVLEAAVRDRLAAHVKACDACRRFTTDVDSLGLDSSMPDVAARIGARLPHGAPLRAIGSVWLPLAAILASVAVGAVIWKARTDGRSAAPAVMSATRPPAPAATGPVALWEIDPPALRLPASVLAPTRSADAGSAARALFDALAGYRANRFAASIAPLETLARDHPESSDIAFYLGATYLLAGRPDAAVGALERARTQAEVTRHEEIDWYLATAEQRAGRAEAARLRLDGLCGGHGQYRERACAAKATLR
jgi:hypothetical protein